MLGITVLFGASLACARTYSDLEKDYFSVSGRDKSSESGSNYSSPLSRQGETNRPILTPTPDDPHLLPSARSQAEQYIVQANDTLGQISQKFGVSVEALAQENQLANPNILDVGQILVIPLPTMESAGPAFKIIPDSELVNGPGSVGFDIHSFVKEMGGFLASYSEEVDGRSLSGTEIVQIVSRNYSVNPRILLAVLEYQSGWVTQNNIPKASRKYPIGVRNPGREGLYRELAWAANSLNRGYYTWRVNGISSWVLNDGTSVPIDPTINAGTAAVQHIYSQLLGLQDWTQAVTENGLFATYNRMFGYPFSYSIEPLLPPDLKQPTMQLPFEPGHTWAFTGGPHGGWDNGSAWAALDFAPPGQALGCVPSDAWVTAVTDGVILRTGDGQVIQDLDGDGYEQTGWVILYMHIDSRDRIQPGEKVKAGDRIGHPSCEGGISSGTHVHLARKYNGEWIPADQDLPFMLDGWVSSGTGKEYDGFLSRNGTRIEAYAGRSKENNIRR
jgi:murein DD-endopeptidase MepM/ murein hydrolase activator NlpD